MGKINFLSEEICNRIAAGEVIERPYSAVKELIDNSLDAGATDIEVYIKRGGKDVIEVIDNGCGIEKDDMRAAFFSHATSKISKMEDIDKITTLGFRGEALATIAAIAMVDLISVVEGQEANKVECDGEYIGKVQPAVLNKGTKITVRNLFFNTPVRAKFMKSDKKEESDITNIITRYILGNPNVAFRYYVDGNLLLQSYGGGLEEAIAQVYGAGFLTQSFKIQAIRNDIKIHGFIGNQNFFKPNKTYQTIFLNGRYIVNSVISGAITNAYSAYAMKRQFPAYTLFVDVPLDTVDVNVHPNKSDVRFVNNALVYGTVYKVISSILDGSAKAADFVVDSSTIPEIKSTFGSPKTKNKVYAAEYKISKNIHDKSFDDIQGMPQFGTKVNKPNKNKINIHTDPEIDYSVYENYEAPVFPERDHIDMNTFNIPEEKRIDFHVDDARQDYVDPVYMQLRQKYVNTQQSLVCEYYTYRGTLFNTYLLYELNDEIYIIDQHAAHERLIYDSLCKHLKNRTIDRQDLIVPYLLDLNPKESQYIQDNILLIRSMGFAIEPFGTYAYRINSIPVDLKGLNFKDFFDELLSDVDGLKEIKLEDVLKDKIAMTACKHAIKGGKELNDIERGRLFGMLEGNMGLKCPHGRPICVKLTKKQIEKMFKRII
jgi:DNA mismatch repair protein MutL